MTSEYLAHYLRGGKFYAFYNPKGTDITPDSKSFIGKRIVVHQYSVTCPLQFPEKWKGQHAFNSVSIGGWFPEEDVTDLAIIPDSYIERVEPLPIYIYRFTYLSEDKVVKILGKGDWKSPFKIVRSYSFPADSAVRKLLDSPDCPDVSERCVWEGKSDELEWEIFK